MSLEELLIQAKTSYKTVSLSFNYEESYVYKGIKICKINDNIKIFSTFNTGLKYREISNKEYNIFYKHGWVEGVHFIVKTIYKENIDKVTNKIKDEVNNRNNKKHYDSLKLRRETLINKYTEINNYVKHKHI